MTRPEPPVLLRRLVGLVELVALAGAAALLVVNVLRETDETLWAALGYLAAWGGARLLPARRRLPARLLLAVLVVMGLVGELGVRHFRDALRGRLYTDLPGDFTWVDDPVLRYTYAPGARCGDGTRTVSRRRICDVPHDDAKPPGTVRIVVLGDSTSLFVDPNDDLWHQRLGRALRADGLPVEVVNGAVEGYGTRQQVAFFERYLLDLAPDLVILAYCLNDPYPGVAIWRPARSKLLRLVALLVASLGMEGDRVAQYLRLHDDPVTWGPVVAAIGRLRGLAARHGFALAGFVMPEMSPGEALDRLYPQVEALLRESGFAVLDLHGDLTSADRARFRSGEDTLHPNAAFHARIADRLAPFLRERGLLPAP